MGGVQIFGEGVAASCCAQLLSRAGIAIVWTGGPQPKVPAIMLGQTAQKLLIDVCQRMDLFEGAAPIRSRMLAWGGSGRLAGVPHSAVVVSEEWLVGRLRGAIAPDRVAAEKTGTGGAPIWSVFAERTPGEKATVPFAGMNHFGARFARASEVTFAAGADGESNGGPSNKDACYLESLEAGWLFTLPGMAGSGWLLSVGGTVDELLGQSRAIAPLLDVVRPSAAEFPCHPRIAETIAGEGWLLCGTAVAGFDPLCGDGAGFATREAILASAVVRAALNGGDAAALSDYYQSGILAGFRKHLGACLDFYRDGGRGPWWKEQCDQVQRGIVWCDEKLRAIVRPPLALRGFELVPLP